MNVTPCLRRHIQRGLLRPRHASPSAALPSSSSAALTRRQNVIVLSNSLTEIARKSVSCPSSPHIYSLGASRSHEADVDLQRRRGEQQQQRRPFSASAAASPKEDYDSNSNSSGGGAGGGSSGG